jgi:hypothetical protein
MTKTKTFTSTGVIIEMMTYEALKVSVRQNEIKQTLRETRPDIFTLKADGLAVLKTFVDQVPYATNIEQIEANEDGQLLAEWWKTFGDFKDIPKMWDEFWDLPNAASNNLLVDAFNATRRDTLMPGEPFQATTIPITVDEKKKKRRGESVYDGGSQGGSAPVSSAETGNRKQGRRKASTKTS